MMLLCSSKPKVTGNAAANLDFSSKRILDMLRNLPFKFCKPSENLLMFKNATSGTIPHTPGLEMFNSPAEVHIRNVLGQRIQ